MYALGNQEVGDNFGNPVEMAAVIPAILRSSKITENKTMKPRMERRVLTDLVTESPRSLPNGRGFAVCARRMAR